MKTFEEYLEMAINIQKDLKKDTYYDSRPELKNRLNWIYDYLKKFKDIKKVDNGGLYRNFFGVYFVDKNAAKTFFDNELKIFNKQYFQKFKRKIIDPRLGIYDFNKKYPERTKNFVTSDTLHFMINKD